MPEATTDRFDEADNALLFSENRSLTVSAPLIDLNQDFSINFWFRMDGAVASSSIQVLLASSGLFVGINDQEQLAIQGFNGANQVIDETVADPLAMQQWNMVTLVSDATNQTLKVFLNGGLSSTTGLSALSTNTEWYFGNSSGQFEFFGKMDDFIFYQKSLTETEIADLYDIDVNEAPTDITLDNDNVDENAEIGTLVGLLSTSDPDVGDTHTYTILEDVPFTINGDNLETTQELDFEMQSSYQLTIQTVDAEGATFSKGFTILVNDLQENSSPTDIVLSTASVDENEDVIATLSTSDPDTEDTHSYTVSGAGLSIINGNQLFINGGFDFESETNVSFDITTDDGNGGSFSKSFTIDINDVNEVPTQISITNTEIEEGLSVASVIGTFSTTDEDANDSHTYSLSGDDAASFNLDGDQLVTAEVFDFETRTSYSITVTSTDQGGLTFSATVSITILDVINENSIPTDISLSNSSLDENEAVGTLVGTLSTTDADENDDHTYTISGTDATSFSINENQLLTSEVFDFEIKSFYSISITTDDGNGGEFTKDFTVAVNDLEETVLSVNDGAKLKVYPNPAIHFVHIETTESIVLINLIDLKGSKVLSTTSTELDLSDLGTGVYFLEVITNKGKKISHRLIKK